MALLYLNGFINERNCMIGGLETPHGIPPSQKKYSVVRFSFGGGTIKSAIRFELMVKGIRICYMSSFGTNWQICLAKKLWTQQVGETIISLAENFESVSSLRGWRLIERSDFAIYLLCEGISNRSSMPTNRNNLLN